LPAALTKQLQAASPKTATLIMLSCLQVLQEMLDMLRDHQNNSHASRLELIIVWLLVVDCCLMLCQVRKSVG